MDAKYDTEQDILRLRWSNAAIEESDQEELGVILDYDQNGKVIGVEILNASRRVGELAGKVQAIQQRREL